LLWKALVQSRERSALRRVALAHDLCETEGAELAADSAEPAACLHGGELSWVPDRDHLRLRNLGGLEQSSAGPGGGHPRLVEDENASLRQLVAELLEVDQQPLERARRNPGLLY
jgi:hypothetical protein